MSLVVWERYTPDSRADIDFMDVDAVIQLTDEIIQDEKFMSLLHESVKKNLRSDWLNRGKRRGLVSVWKFENKLERDAKRDESIAISRRNEEVLREMGMNLSRPSTQASKKLSTARSKKAEKAARDRQTHQARVRDRKTYPTIGKDFKGR